MIQCESCKNIKIGKLSIVSDEITGTCTAYPNGIPLEIWDDKVSHEKSYKGDGGIQYEKYADGWRL